MDSLLFFGAALIVFLDIVTYMYYRYIKKVDADLNELCGYVTSIAVVLVLLLP